MWADDHNIEDLVGNEIESMRVEEMCDGMNLKNRTFSNRRP